jgi:hypothetical protein
LLPFSRANSKTIEHVASPIYFWKMKMKAVRYSETSANFISQKRACLLPIELIAFTPA